MLFIPLCFWIELRVSGELAVVCSGCSEVTTFVPFIAILWQSTFKAKSFKKQEKSLNSSRVFSLKL